MLLSLTEIIQKYKIPVKGIAGIGAHHAIECEEYLQLGFNPIVLVEPCTAQFSVLFEKYFFHPGITLHKVACGDIEGKGMMYVETRNQGQSNSLLKPAKHTQYYPDIVFNDTEQVDIKRLDNLITNPQDFSVLNCDVQGAEGKVLLGCPQILAYVDMIYLEVNREDLYEGATMVDSLDILLSEFERVETFWTGQGWGDSVFISKRHLNLIHG